MALERLRSILGGTAGLILSAIIIGVTLFLFIAKLATRSHPRDHEEFAVAVRDSVFVHRNSFGVPHIVARSETDLFYTQGFVHAQDRMWQMDFMRRAGRGRLSEILGKRLIDVDKYLRTLDVAGIARKQLANVSPTTKAILTAYAAGVNAYLDENRGEYPFEIDALNYTPDPWTPEDCLIVGRMLAFDLSMSFVSDLAFAQIAQQRTEEVARQYIPGWPSGAPIVLDSGGYVPPPVRVDTSRAPAIQASHDIDLGGMSRAWIATREGLGMGLPSGGSNAWAVSKGDNGAIVANDPHLGVSMPSHWYQIHLTCPTINVVGMSVPGLPLILSGRNDRVAWGLTNTMLDDVDYFVEKVDPARPDRYLSNDSTRRKFTWRVDTIRIAGEPDSIYETRFTHRSAVLSDHHLLRDPSFLFRTSRVPATKLLQRSVLTYRWTASQPGDEVRALYNLNKAANADDIVRAVRSWHSPAQNVTFGVYDGTVGTVVAGMVPIRPNTDPHFLNDGTDPRTDWTGMMHMADLGVRRVKGRGWSAAANNKTTSRSGAPFIGSIWEPASRAQRIEHLLKLFVDYSVRDAQVMQQDVTSPAAIDLRDRLVSILKKGISRLNAVDREALKVLERWNGEFTPISYGASIAAMLEQRMIQNTFEDELGWQLFTEYGWVGNVPPRRLRELIDTPQHPLFDDVRTTPREDLAWITIRSFVEAVRELRQRTGSDTPSEWRWGAQHELTLRHTFSTNPVMRPTMDRGPYPIGGSTTTISKMEWRMWAPFSTVIYPSMRIISDLRDSIQYSVVPGGISGQPLDAHYADQVELYLRGGYVRVPVRAKPDVTFSLFTTLVPR